MVLYNVLQENNNYKSAENLTLSYIFLFWQ